MLVVSVSKNCNVNKLLLLANSPCQGEGQCCVSTDQEKEASC